MYVRVHAHGILIEFRQVASRKSSRCACVCQLPLLRLVDLGFNDQRHAETRSSSPHNALHSPSYRPSANRKFEIVSTRGRARVLENCYPEFRIARAFCKPADERSRLPSIFFSVCLPEEEEASSSVRSWLVSCGQLVSLFVARPRAG